MSFAEFFKSSVLEARLAKSQVMVVYDPERRYRDVCLEMATEKRAVVDSSESSIISRAKAIADLGKLGERQIEQLLVYVPAAKPLEDEDKQKDPFALYGACGDVFPSGDGDNYLSLCLKAKPDHATQVRAVFDQDPNPSLAVIDAIGGGLNWPSLRALLKVESTRDILFALLVPSDLQQNALKESDTWVSEAKALLQASIGLGLKTRGKARSAIGDELWRFVLFSEFVFDLPEELPPSLQDVPCAAAAAQPLIEDMCERLRSDRRTQNIYIERAETIEAELDLPSICGHMADLGERDTFPFEERTFLQRAMEALARDDTDKVKAILGRHAQSVWTGKGESQAQWDLIRSAFSLMECCQDNDRLLSEHTRSMDRLIDLYVSQLREIDRLHREFEQAVSDYDWQDAQGIMQPVQQQARKQYGKLIEKVQLLFTKHLQHTGWPVVGRLANGDVFDKLVAPKLQQSGIKVAYLMVDALRYELGVALEKQLAEDGMVELKPALAQLPSITPVGMASLLPGAGTGLRLVKNESGYTPHLGDQPVANVGQRMEILRKRYGQRFQEGRLEEFVRNRFEVDGDVELLVLRSVEIDSHFENHPDTAPTEIINALKRIRVAVHKLKDAGFSEVVIATDHGFFMNTHAGAGDTCSKLPGDWLNEHQRCLLGDGSSDSHHYLLSAEKAGIRGDFTSIAGPLSMASYKSGMLYYHGGASLQECVVPVITLQLDASEQAPVSQATVSLNYKNGAKRITTRLPVIEISLDNQDMFSVGRDFEILLEAHDKKGEVVGEAKPGGLVNPATGTITLKPGDKVQVTLKMQMEYEGKFKVKALNPSTMVAFCQLDLETDYTV
ncbi:PglZ domain-containing protein [Sneathiella sp. P13V-1]|uniref:PglZ domain-containing protein n=1 Tax=Sneathiella sp. P13V-1 TaxID=2697366 RepID=UPI00187B624C|nr:PglZ domain-containing protein [Sneathiella sp. P13V-1]MBE7635964.1 PglZ domain-containing protein [Sneathiella sp. P13V-1]